MAGLLDIFKNISPEQNRGLLAAASHILQQSGPGRPFTLGQAMGSGIEAFQGSVDQQRQRAMQDQFRTLQLEDVKLELQGKREARTNRQREIEAARGAYRTAGQQAAALPGGPTVANAERIGEFKDTFDTEAYVNAVMQFDPLRALELRRSLAKAGPKFDTKPQTAIGEDGKAFQYIVAENGEIKRLDGVLPRDELKLANLGGKDVAYNPFALKEGQTFQRTATPGDLLSAQTARRGQDITMRGQNMTDTRQREMVALHRQIGKAPTEFQGKSAAFGLRATEADKAITSLTGHYDPSAVNVKTSLEGWPLVGGMLGAAVNKFALSSSDQKAEQAKRDFINAVLRQESGAAIGASEFDNADKQYFPQPGDGPDVVAQKARNRQLAIQGLQSNAGRAAMTAPPTAGGGFTFLGFE